MDPQRVTENLMLLLGMMQRKNNTNDFMEEIRNEDVENLSFFMEHLNLDNFEKCPEWEFCTSEEIEKIEKLILAVNEENKHWACLLMRMAEHLLETLTSSK